MPPVIDQKRDRRQGTFVHTFGTPGGGASYERDSSNRVLRVQGYPNEVSAERGVSSIFTIVTPTGQPARITSNGISQNLIPGSNSTTTVGNVVLQEDSGTFYVSYGNTVGNSNTIAFNLAQAPGITSLGDITFCGPGLNDCRTLSNPQTVTFSTANSNNFPEDVRIRGGAATAAPSASTQSPVAAPSPAPAASPTPAPAISTQTSTDTSTESTSPSSTQTSTDTSTESTSPSSTGTSTDTSTESTSPSSTQTSTDTSTESTSPSSTGTSTDTSTESTSPSSTGSTTPELDSSTPSSTETSTGTTTPQIVPPPPAPTFSPTFPPSVPAIGSTTPGPTPPGGGGNDNNIAGMSSFGFGMTMAGSAALLAVICVALGIAGRKKDNKSHIYNLTTRAQHEGPIDAWTETPQMEWTGDPLANDGSHYDTHLTAVKSCTTPGSHGKPLDNLDNLDNDNRANSFASIIDLAIDLYEYYDDIDKAKRHYGRTVGADRQHDPQDIRGKIFEIALNVFGDQPNGSTPEDLFDLVCDELFLGKDPVTGRYINPKNDEGIIEHYQGLRLGQSDDVRIQIPGQVGGGIGTAGDGYTTAGDDLLNSPFGSPARASAGPLSPGAAAARASGGRDRSGVSETSFPGRARDSHA